MLVPSVLTLVLLSGDPQYVLRWTAAEGCSADGDTLMRSVEGRLGRAVFTDHALRTIEVTLTHDDNWRAVVEVRDAAGASLGVREVSRPACAELETMLVLVVSLMIGSGPEEAPAPPPPAPTARPPQRVVGAGRLSLVGGYGELFTLSAGVRIAGILRRTDAWSLELFATGWLPQWFSVPNRAVRANAASAGIAFCLQAFHRGRVTFEGCGAGQAGATWARGFGFDESQQGASPTGDLGLSARLDFSLGRGFVLHFGVSGWGRLTTPQLTYLEGSARETLATAPPVAVDLEAAIAWGPP